MAAILTFPTQQQLETIKPKLIAMLIHKPSHVVVFQSENYKDFIFLTGNRPINKKKCYKIIAEIKSGNDMLEYKPIEVRVIKDKLAILDGQNRFHICKTLKRPVYYILVKEEKEMHEIARVNSNVEKWTQQNFINCYITKGNQHYQTLQEFIDEFGINVGTSVNLLRSGHPGADGSSNDAKTLFESGAFEVKHLSAAKEIAKLCQQFSFFHAWRDRAFIIAIYKIQCAGLISIKDLAAACEKNIDMMEKQATYKQYIFNLEKIVNKNKQKRVVII